MLVDLLTFFFFSSLRSLIVINMSQQSDSADLLGGFKPVNIRALAEPVLDRFRKAFFKTFSRKQNATFVGKVRCPVT